MASKNTSHRDANPMASSQPPECPPPYHSNTSPRLSLETGEVLLLVVGGRVTSYPQGFFEGVLLLGSAG